VVKTNQIVYILWNPMLKLDHGIGFLLSLTQTMASRPVIYLSKVLIWVTFFSHLHSAKSTVEENI